MKNEFKIEVRAQRGLWVSEPAMTMLKALAVGLLASLLPFAARVPVTSKQECDIR